MIRRASFFLSIVVCFLFGGVFFANAAPLTDISYRLTSPLSGAYSNHLIMFRSPSGVSGGTITVDMASVASSFSSFSISDLSLMYQGAKVTLAATAGAGVWGASISDGRVLSFTYPVTGGTPIPAGSMVVISTQGGATTRPVNAGEAGAKNANITAQSDTGAATVTLQSTAPIGTQMINGASGNGLRVGISAGANAGETGVSLISNGSFGVAAGRLDQVVTYGVGGILAPSDMVGTSSGEGRIELGWADNTNIGLGYVVERREIKEGVETSYEPVAILDRESTRFTDTNLKSQTQYQYRLRAFNTVNFSSYLTSGVIQTPAIAVPFAPLAGFIPGFAKKASASSQPARSETPSQGGGDAAAVQPIANVGNLSGVPGAGTVELSWENPSDPDYLYTQVQWSDSGFPQSQSEGVTVSKDTLTAFSDVNLPGGVPSYYTVYAVSKYGVYSSGAFIAVTPITPTAPVAPPPSAAKGGAGAPANAPTGTAPSAPVQPPVSEATASQPVTLTLQPSVEKTFTPTAQGAVQITNPDSLGGSQVLVVSIPPATVNANYQVSVASYSLDQAQEIDASIAVPADYSIASHTVYRVTIEKEALEVRKLEKPITLEFRYSPTSLGDVDEQTLQARYWDPLASQWLAVPSMVDTQRKLVIATTNHLSLFSLFGEKRKGGESGILKVIAIQKLPKNSEATLKPAALFDLSQFVKVEGRELSAVAGSETAFCVNQALFERPVRFMTISINQSKYFLVYDFRRRCYAGTIVMPKTVGTHSMQTKVVFADDFSQTGDFTLVTTPKKPLFQMPAPSAAPASSAEESRTPFAFLLIVLLAVIAIYSAIAWRTVTQWHKL